MHDSEHKYATTMTQTYYRQSCTHHALNKYQRQLEPIIKCGHARLV